MRLTSRFLGWTLAAALLAPVAMRAQEPGGPLAKQLGPGDIIMPHITDSKTIEWPCVKGWQEWACEYTFATHNVTIAGHTFDMGLTKHIFFMILAAIILCIVLIWTARSHVRSTERVGRPKGFAAGLEAIILYLRNEIYIPVLGGHGGERYVPFVPHALLLHSVLQPVRADSLRLDRRRATSPSPRRWPSSRSSSSRSPGIKALGTGYIGTIVYWPHDMSSRR